MVFTEQRMCWGWLRKKEGVNLTSGTYVSVGALFTFPKPVTMDLRAIVRFSQYGRA